MWHRSVHSVKLTALCVAACAAASFTNLIAAQIVDCNPPPEDTFTVSLPKVGLPPDEEGQGWVRPKVWEHHPTASDDSITIPNGRPIYALIVGGYASNRYLDELMVYRFAKHLMEQGAYVHYAWWNNLLAPYMERPLHHAQSTPGDLDKNFDDFTTAKKAGKKAVPAEDYQFVADAELFLSAIREHNPNAMIIVVGHSMGGGAVVHLASKTDVLIDILAPIDPVGNRNYPWAGLGRKNEPDFNWTRWRVSRSNFKGYKQLVRDGLQCVPEGPWLPTSDTDNPPFCDGFVHVHSNAAKIKFGSHVVNLYHRYQKEAKFPFDFKEAYHFNHDKPPNGDTNQKAITMKPAFISFGERYPDPGGWPANGKKKKEGCCTSGTEGVGWANDGHGEIVGYRGSVPNPVPLALRVITSPQCGSNCDNLTWPSRVFSGNTWSDPDSATRVQILQDLELLLPGSDWDHTPKNPAMCRVSTGLINKFDSMNKPPFADAGGDQVVESTGFETPVMLDGLNSSDPDGDTLEYDWSWATGSAVGPVAIANLPEGTHCVTLEVRDPSGHVDRNAITVIVEAGNDDGSSDEDDSSDDSDDDDGSDDDDSSDDDDGCSDGSSDDD